MKKKKELILGVSLIVIIIAMAIVLVIINKDDKKEFEDVQVTTTVEESTKANDSSNTFMEETIIKCCYELRYIFAINEFDDISTVSVNKLAQYGLCQQPCLCCRFSWLVQAFTIIPSCVLCLRSS